MANGRTVVTAYAESASGPGWANRPLWVIIPEEYHAHMKFKVVTAGRFEDMTGEIVAVDFQLRTIDLRFPDVLRPVEFPLSDVTLVDHEHCGCDVVVKEVA